LKKEHQIKEIELKSLNRKVVDYDGDIPMEELMKLQEKLKNSNPDYEQKPQVTFINDKETHKISNKHITTNYTNVNTNYTKNTSNTATTTTITKTVQQPSISPKPQNPKSTYQLIRTASNPQPTKKNVDVWSSAFTASKPSQPSTAQRPPKPTHNFDAFNDVFGNASTDSKPIHPKKMSNNDNFF
jgi:hypothetical protein